MTLKDLKTGSSAIVKNVNGVGSHRQHFLDMGVIPGAVIKVIKYAPMGDPLELLIHGYALTLRVADASQIDVEEITEAESDRLNFWQIKTDENFPYIKSLHEHNSHPGFGEDKKFYSKSEEKTFSMDNVLTFALVGQQNCGKTTLFNQLTGSNQHVGNFPGLTVDRKDGVIKGYPYTRVTDLPGIYSLSPYTSEEIVSRRFILEEKPKAIINIVDAGNIERNLYLTIQLLELEIPMVLALNMMDEVKNNSGSIRVNEMEKILGIPVIPISASKNEGIGELVDHAIHVAKYQENPVRQDFCSKEDWGGAVHRCLHTIMHLIEDHAEAAGIPIRFAVVKLIEGDQIILEALKLTQNEKETIEHIIQQMESERGLDRYAAIADLRFSFIQKLCSRTVIKPKESKEYLRSRKMDRILTGKYTSIPIFVIIMSLIIWLSIDVIGLPLQNLLDGGIQWVANVCDIGMKKWQISDTLRSLVVDGIFGGVGVVVSFIPIIIIMFLFLSLMEDSGYMARVAFITDKLLRKIGLTGHSIVPMLIGFGCSVPAILSTRTLCSSRDRKLTILMIPFMSCSAKIPIYAFFSAAFFPKHGGLVLVLLYLLSILLGVIMALASKLIYKKEKAVPFVMELPIYRMPSIKNVLHLLWDKTRDFLQKAFTVIFVATMIIWFLQTFDFHFKMVEGGSGSMLASVSGFIAPIFKPLGLGDWKIVTALISGFMAKESVVATMGVLNIMNSLTTLMAIPMLIFILLYTPCVAAIATIKRELGWKWAFHVVFFQCVLAWICAYFAYLLAGLIL